MTQPDQSDQKELAHLVRISLLHPNSREFAEWKARDLAGRMPNRWGWLPAALSSAIASAPTPAEPSSRKPAEPSEKE